MKKINHTFEQYMGNGNRESYSRQRPERKHNKHRSDMDSVDDPADDSNDDKLEEDENMSDE